MARARILVVDDEEGVRSSLMSILRDEGYLVETAESGEKCLEMLGKNEYQAVFLDVWMPGKDGMEILAEVTARPGAPAVVMIRSASSWTIRSWTSRTSFAGSRRIGSCRGHCIRCG
jgi:two-component system nitrogen regulation response regulator NtrX